MLNNDMLTPETTHIEYRNKYHDPSKTSNTGTLITFPIAGLESARGLPVIIREESISQGPFYFSIQNSRFALMQLSP